MKRREKLENELRELTTDVHILSNYIKIIEDKLKNESNEWLDEEVEE
jgi:hypothetical protein